MGNHEDFRVVTHLLWNGRLSPVIDRVFPLKELDAAHRRVFLVWPCSGSFDFPVRYRNADYTVYEVVPGAPGGPAAVSSLSRRGGPERRGG